MSAREKLLAELDEQISKLNKVAKFPGKQERALAVAELTKQAKALEKARTIEEAIAATQEIYAFRISAIRHRADNPSPPTKERDPWTDILGQSLPESVDVLEWMIARIARAADPKWRGDVPKPTGEKKKVGQPALGPRPSLISFAAKYIEKFNELKTDKATRGALRAHFGISNETIAELKKDIRKIVGIPAGKWDMDEIFLTLYSHNMENERNSNKL